jgi:hypothetical protein
VPSVSLNILIPCVEENESVPSVSLNVCRPVMSTLKANAPLPIVMTSLAVSSSADVDACIKTSCLETTASRSISARQCNIDEIQKESRNFIVHAF